MKPFKQPIYLPVIKHNVGCEYRILNSDNVTEHFAVKQESFVFTSEQLNEYTQNVIKQALETAAEKAETEYCGNPYDYEDNSQCVDRQSITNTFEETFKKFEV